MPRVSPAALAAVLVPLGLVAAGARAAPAHASPRGAPADSTTRPVAHPQDAGLGTDLTAVLDTGRILQDRNGDRVIDYLDVVLVLPARPGAAEAAAAADLAARLGYETSAADLGYAATDDGRRAYERPVLAVGASNGLLGRAGMDAAAEVAGLAPGQGLLLPVPAGEAARAGGVAVLGWDASGTLAAAAYLAGRYPAVWKPEGTTWKELRAKVDSLLSGGGVAADSLLLDRIVVDGGEPGIVRARVTVVLPDSVAFEQARAALSPPDTVEEATAPEGDTIRGEAPQPDSATATARLHPSDLEVPLLHRLDVRLVAPGDEHTMRLRPREPWPAEPARPGHPDANRAVSLARLYSVDGLYRDTNQDLVPDEVPAFLSLSGAAGALAIAGRETDARAAVEARGAVARATVDLATRIGLEAAGLRAPLASVDGQQDLLERRGFPVAIGRDHYQVRRLQDEDRLFGTAADPPPSTGFVQVVDGAFGGADGMAVGGADDRGVASALDWLAGRAPYLWTYGKGEYRLADAETAVRRFFQGRSAAGQLALALAKLGQWMDRDAADGTSPRRIEVELAADSVAGGVADVAAGVIGDRFPGADVSVRTWPTGFGVGDTIFTRELDLPWEVDEVREVLQRELYPRVRAGTPVHVEVRVSEPREVRDALAREVRAALAEQGAPDAEVTVLSAYKQGYSWVTEVLLPRLRSLPVGRIDVTYHTLQESDEVRWQTVAADTRWLQELYPVDAVLARELGIPDSAVVFHPTREPDPIYRVVVRDTTGAVALDETFDPHYVVRPFFDLFPEYEHVRVTTGWITATAGGDTLVDRRVVTDPERFWDVLQTDTYARIADYVMDIQQGEPSPANAPYFDALTVRLRMSEPNRRIGVDEEVISSLEALHEDIYFETLTLFDLLGSRYQTSLPYPGRVLPRIDPTGTGEPPSGRITFTGKERGAPELVVRTWADTTAPPRVRRYDLSPLGLPAPRLVGVAVEAGREELRQMLVRVEATDSLDRYREFEGRADEAAIDRRFLSVELLERMVDALRRLHGAGLETEALAWDRVGGLAVRFALEDDSTWARVTTLPRTERPTSTETPTLYARGWTYGGGPMVQWDTPIPPAENDSILARLATFPGVDVYYLTRSFLGQPVWAADFLPPQPARYVSQAKLNALKPTLFISGRQHANEVSSTSHILRLAELLATDSTYRALLDRVNVVLHPITNPDGARLAVEMQETNPDFMLHAGYLGALGVDATSGERDDDPVYPESQARRRLRETWLPDVYVNMHGYPSHEWVQYFAGYSAWVRNRRGGARDWWSPRGWFVPGFTWVDDEEHPDYRTAQFALLDSVAASITGDPEVDAMNRRLYARYRKYGVQDQDEFREYFHDGMLVYLALDGQESIGSGVYSPRITWFSATTEAPDETARGDWLKLVARAGLDHATALLRYLATGTYDVEREAEARDGVVTRKVYRVKPVLPPSPSNPRD